jgi:hypothetical protein
MGFKDERTLLEADSAAVRRAVRDARRRHRRCVRSRTTSGRTRHPVGRLNQRRHGPRRSAGESGGL